MLSVVMLNVIMLSVVAPQILIQDYATIKPVPSFLLTNVALA